MIRVSIDMEERDRVHLRRVYGIRSFLAFNVAFHGVIYRAYIKIVIVYHGMEDISKDNSSIYSTTTILKVHQFSLLSSPIIIPYFYLPT